MDKNPKNISDEEENKSQETDAPEATQAGKESDKNEGKEVEENNPQGFGKRIDKFTEDVESFTQKVRNTKEAGNYGEVTPNLDRLIAAVNNLKEAFTNLPKVQ